MILKQSHVIMVKSRIIRSACLSPCYYNDVLALYSLIIIDPENLSDLSAESMSDNTVPDLFAHRYTDSVMILIIIPDIHHQDTVSFGSAGIIYHPVFTVLFYRRESFHTNIYGFQTELKGPR